MVGPERPQFVLFGSSIVQLSFSNGGWGAILADLYSRKVVIGSQNLWEEILVQVSQSQWIADIVLRGYSGWNSRRALQVLDQVFPKDAAVQPSLVIVYFGGNDSVQPHPSGLGSHVPLPEYLENMRKIATHLKGLSEKTRIIFLTAPPINEDQIRECFSNNLGAFARKNELCGEYSEACLKLCKEMDIKAIDLWTAIQKRKDWLSTSFLDGIHFTAEASTVVVKEILKVLNEANWEPSLHNTSIPAEFGEDSPYDPISSDEKTTLNVSDCSFERIIKWGMQEDGDIN